MVKDNPISLIKPPRTLRSSLMMIIIKRPANKTRLLIRTYFFISSPSISHVSMIFHHSSRTSSKSISYMILTFIITQSPQAKKDSIYLLKKISPIKRKIEMNITLHNN